MTCKTNLLCEFPEYLQRELPWMSRTLLSLLKAIQYGPITMKNKMLENSSYHRKRASHSALIGVTPTLFHCRANFILAYSSSASYIYLPLKLHVDKQAAGQRLAQFVLCRIAVPTIPAQTVSWSTHIIMYLLAIARQHASKILLWF